MRAVRNLTLVTLLFIVATAQTATPDGISPSELFPGATFDPAVPTQKGLLGVEHGSRPLRHGELLQFLRALAEASPRATMWTYSETHEGRPMVVLAVSEPATLERLDEFKTEHVRRMDPRGRKAAEDEAALADAKAVAWMAYSIHGDELSGTDAAAAVAYRLVAGEDEAARELRRELVILIDPCENPDGRDRYLAQTASFAHSAPNPDTSDLSHAGVWPWGRGNHYLFDLNRDWFSMVQPESRRSEEIASWLPQLMVDAHEMGPDSTYLFSPPRHPFNPHAPEHTWKWADVFAADQSKALDERGYAYYTGEWNEEFFPGYGSAWPSYFGTVGILYEMSRTSGTLVLKREGTTRTFAEAVEHQAASSVANLTTLAENRAEVLADFVEGRRRAVAAGTTGPVGAWILPRDLHPERVDALVDLLRRQGIEVFRSTADELNATGLRDARTGAAVDAGSIGADAWMVPLDQPSGPLVRVLLDPHIPMEAEFLREEREYQERLKGTRLYETTAWSLALARGLEAYWTPRRPTQGFEQTPVPERKGRLQARPRAFGYVMEGRSDSSVLALADMLERGLSVRIARDPFTVDGGKFDRGAVLIKSAGNPDDLVQQLAEIVERRSVVISGVPTAKAQEGPDLGGGRFLELRAPRIGVFTGMPVSPSSYGALWHLLDRDVGLRFTALDLGRAAAVDLSRYNVLVFPPTFGGARAYRERFGEAGLEKLRDWIEAGGTAVGIGGGTEFLAAKQLELTKARLRREALDRYPPVVLGPGAERVAVAGNFRAVGIRAAPSSKDDVEIEKKRDRENDGTDSPYDVAPILGAGAKPFTEGFDQGTPVPLEPADLGKWLEPFLPPGKDKADAEDIAWGDARLRRFSPRGVFLLMELDHEIWLSWGVPAEMPGFVRSSDTLVAEPPVQVAARFADLGRLHLGGLLWPEAAGRLAHTAYVTRERVGRGQVILFLNEPEFRGWTLGTRRLLLNALLYGPGLGTDWPKPW